MADESDDSGKMAAVCRYMKRKLSDIFNTESNVPKRVAIDLFMENFVLRPVQEISNDPRLSESEKQNLIAARMRLDENNVHRKKLLKEKEEKEMREKIAEAAGVSNVESDKGNGDCGQNALDSVVAGTSTGAKKRRRVDAPSEAQPDQDCDKTDEVSISEIEPQSQDDDDGDSEIGMPGDGNDGDLSDLDDDDDSGLSGSDDDDDSELSDSDDDNDGEPSGSEDGDGDGELSGSDEDEDDSSHCRDEDDDSSSCGCDDCNAIKGGGSDAKGDNKVVERENNQADKKDDANDEEIEEEPNEVQIEEYVKEPVAGPSNQQMGGVPRAELTPSTNLQKRFWCMLGCDRVFPSVNILRSHVESFHKRSDASRINKYNYACWDLPISRRLPLQQVSDTDSD